VYEFKGTRESTHLYETAVKLVPGGTHLYGKRSEFHASGFWPAYVARAEGGHRGWDRSGVFRVIRRTLAYDHWSHARRECRRRSRPS
jgi:hypothetical protein